MRNCLSLRKCCHSTCPYVQNDIAVTVHPSELAFGTGQDNVPLFRGIFDVCQCLKSVMELQGEALRGRSPPSSTSCVGFTQPEDPYLTIVLTPANTGNGVRVRVGADIHVVRGEHVVTYLLSL